MPASGNALPAAAPTRAPGPRVLVIDGNGEHQILAITALGRAGFRVDAATTAIVGLRLARETRYDAIVVDHKLRDMSGLATLGSLNDLDRDAPKVYLVAVGSEEAAVRAAEQGAAGILVKSANFFELLPLEVSRAIEARRARVEFDRQREALRAAEDRYRALFERAQDPVFILDSKGSLLGFNHALGDLTGYEREELLRMNLFDLLFVETDGTGGPVASLSPSGSEPGPTVFGLRRKDGTIAYLEVTTRLVRQGSLVAGVEGTARDVTARWTAEMRLAKERARASAVADAAGEGILVTDEAGVIVVANDRMSEILGVPRAQLLGGRGTDAMMTLAERVADAAAFREDIERTVREPQAVLEGELEIVGPARKRIRHHYGLVRTADGSSAGRLWILREAAVDGGPSPPER